MKFIGVVILAMSTMSIVSQNIDRFEVSELRMNAFFKNTSYNYNLQVKSHFQTNAEFTFKITIIKLVVNVSEDIFVSKRNIAAGQRVNIPFSLIYEKYSQGDEIYFHYSIGRTRMEVKKFMVNVHNNKKFSSDDRTLNITQMIIGGSGSVSQDEMFKWHSPEKEFTLSHDLMFDYSRFYYSYLNTQKPTYTLITLTLFDCAKYYPLVVNNEKDAVFKVQFEHDGSSLVLMGDNYFYDPANYMMATSNASGYISTRSIFFPSLLKQEISRINAELHVLNFNNLGYSYRHNFTFSLGQKYFGENGINVLEVDYNV